MVKINPHILEGTRAEEGRGKDEERENTLETL